MQFSAILCLATYEWFCADGSHIIHVQDEFEIGALDV